MDVLLAICFTSIALTTWGAICNFQTAAQKKALIDVISAEAQIRIMTRTEADGFGDWLRLYAGVQSVSYDRHLFANMLFCDPLNLYPPEIQALARRAPLRQAQASPRP